MAQLVYVDETGSVGTGAASQPYLTLVGVMVPAGNVQRLGQGVHEVAMQHLGWIPGGFEFHGHELWGGSSWWKEKTPPQLLAAFEGVIGLLQELDLYVAHASIDKAMLHQRYNGAADGNAYRLALQFLLEKIDKWNPENKIIIADEAKEQELRAIKMVADMQQWNGAGEVPGMPLKTVIDSLHFVRSHASPGVQMADLVAYVLQRARRRSEKHPDAAAARDRLKATVDLRTATWRDQWPRQPR